MENNASNSLIPYVIVGSKIASNKGNKTDMSVTWLDTEQ